MEELEHTAKQIKANAEQLESVCLDKLAHLYQDKRRVRKQYQEEHTKIATKFSHVSTYFYVPYMPIGHFDPKQQTCVILLIRYACM